MNYSDDLSLDIYLNIDQFSDDQMNVFLDEVTNIDEEGKSNLLIVTTQTKIDETYGAVNVIEAPNNQYFIEYATEEEKENAFLQFNELGVIVEDNEIMTIDTLSYDSYYNSWGIEAMGLDVASSIANEKELEEVVVAIIDSGLNVSYFEKFYDDKIKDVYSVITSDYGISDVVGHGTHIAGTIAEGTSENVKILPIKVTDTTTFYASDAIAAIDYIVYNQSASVINISSGSYTNLVSYELAVLSAKESDIIVVAAAGNDDLDSLFYPASYDSTISVSAVDSNLEKADFSNYGNEVTFSAPGDDILSINGLASGTSMASPHVASAVAILKSYNLDYTFEEILSILVFYSDDLGDFGYDDLYGYGLINMANIVYCDEISCDEPIEYGDYDETSYIKLEVDEDIILPEYDYGTITNLGFIKLKLYYNQVDYVEYNIFELEGLDIDGYDPTKLGTQQITVSYEELTDTFSITINQLLESVWQYEILDDENIKITGYKGFDSSITTVEIPNEINGYNVSVIGEGVFGSTCSLEDDFNIGPTKIVLPENVVEIDNCAFKNNVVLESLVANSSNISIGDYAFASAKNLVEFDGYLSYVGEGAFQYCDSLDVFNFSDSIKTISRYAFYNTNIGDLIIPNSVDTIGEYAFSNADINNLYIGSGLQYLGDKAFFENENLVTISVDDDNYFFDSRDNSNALIEVKESEITLIVASNSTNAIPNTVTSLGDSSFAFRTIETLYIPEGIISVNDAFFNTIIGELYLPNSLDYELFTDLNELDNVVSLYRVYSDVLSIFDFESDYLTIDAVDSFIEVGKTYYIEEEVVDVNDISLSLQYGSNIEDFDILKEVDGSDIVITYQNDVQYLTTDDDRYFINVYDDYGNVVLETFVLITVDPLSVIEPNIVIENKVYDGTNSIDFNTISITNLDDDYYTVESAVLNDINAGNSTVDITIRLTDEAYNDIQFQYISQEKTFTVEIIVEKADSLIVYASGDREVYYDGFGHGIDLVIEYPIEVDIKYADEFGDYILDEMPLYKSVGQYVIKYKLSIDDNYTELFGENVLEIYGLSCTTDSVVIDEGYMIITDYNNVLSYLNDSLMMYGQVFDYKILNSSNEVVESDYVKTGDKYEVILNEFDSFEYQIVVLGDVYADGKVSSLDYVKIKNHIMETSLISDDFVLIAADVNGDDKISALDYVKIKNYIMNGGD